MRDFRRILICLVALLLIMLLIATVGYYSIVSHFQHDIDFKDCVTFAIAIITLAFTFGEYLSKKESDKTNLLLSYNERFIKDEKIQKVITYLQYFDENRDKPSFDPKSIEEPKKSEFILFARFFEELQTIIESNNIDKEYVCRLYAYYAIEAYDNHKDKIGTVEDNSWHLFRTFCEEMKKVEEKLEIKH